MALLGSAQGSLERRMTRWPFFTAALLALVMAVAFVVATAVGIIH